MPRQSEIANFNIEIVDQDIVGFDISMNDSMVVQVRKHWQKLLDDVFLLFLRKLNFLLVQQIIKCSILYILHDDA